MICPKCGFDQPDEAYCAFCGINTKKYRQERRKKQYIVYLLVSFVVIAGIFIAINSIHKVKTPESATPYAEKKGEDQIKDIDLPETKRERFEARQESRTEKRIDRQRPSVSKREAFIRPERLEDEGTSEIEPSRRLPLAEPTAGSIPETRQGEKLTAGEWFEKGRALDDESDAEVEFYEKALELNPEFAPAFYWLGAIHFRRAKYELADQEFAKFIEYASEADRQTHDIYVYYSPSDMERLSAAAMTEKASAEEEEKESPVEALGEASAEVEEEDKEALSEAEEVEKTPEETEEGQETAAESEEIEAEAEETEKEAAEETEEAETETPVGVPKEAEEEAEY